MLAFSTTLPISRLKRLSKLRIGGLSEKKASPQVWGLGRG